jgi:hypothetical protein
MLNTVFNLIGSHGKVTPFSPLSLSPDLWLKADAGTLQTVGGTAASADGDPVGSYLDNSTNANNASQATASKRPTLKLNVANSLPMIMPDTVDDMLGITSAIALTGAFTVYAVGTRAAGTIWIPVGRNGGDASVLIYSDNNIYFVIDDTTFVHDRRKAIREASGPCRGSPRSSDGVGPRPVRGVR